MLNSNYDPFSGVLDVVQEHIATFKGFAKKSAESTLEMAKTVVAVKALGEKNFEDFCNGIGYAKDSKVLVKLHSIGKKADIFIAHIDVLPNSWTTLYFLSQLSDVQLKDIAENGKIHPSLSGLQTHQIVTAIKGKKLRTKPSSPTEMTGTFEAKSYSIAIQFETVPSADDVLELKRILAEFRDRTGCNVNVSDFLDALLQEATDTESEV